MDLINQKIKINYNEAKPELIAAIDMLVWAINEPELRTYILNFKNTYGFLGFLQTTENNEKILERFVLGSERGSTPDCEWDIVISLFTADGIIGYTEAGDPTINLNTKYLDRELPEICNTLSHEYCHLVGMVHSFNNPGWGVWEQTAPYAIGQYVQHLVSKKLGTESKPPFFPIVSRKKRVVYTVKRFLRKIFS